MITVIQRVKEAAVDIGGKRTASIGHGLLVLVGIENADGDEDVEWLSTKLVNLRIFNDSEGVMNLGIKEVNGEMLVVSQFTLHASTKKGNRPSYIQAARPEVAVPLYDLFVRTLGIQLGKPVATGVFGADMQVSLVNDGPVTILINTKDKK